MINILIVDDNQRIHQAIKMVLESDKRHEYSFKDAYNGEEGVRATVLKSFDLCLMDLDMPIMDGLTASKYIHSNIHGGYMPIIAVTGHRIIGSEFKIMNQHIDDFLEKPFKSDDLLKKIDEWYLSVDVLERKEETINFYKELPMDKAQLEKLKELREQGLGYFMLRGTKDLFITHKNVQNKISHDFASGKFLSEFLDRNPDNPGQVHLYNTTAQANQFILTPEEMGLKIKIEDKLLNEEIYQTKADTFKTK
jgi:response regulator RpfG family c-di-GMP phosphodiesterase